MYFLPQYPYLDASGWLSRAILPHLRPPHPRIQNPDKGTICTMTTGNYRNCNVQSPKLNRKKIREMSNIEIRQNLVAHAAMSASKHIAEIHIYFRKINKPFQMKFCEILL